MEESSAYSAAQVPPEVQFAQILENFQMSSGDVSPFDITQNFISVSAARALDAGRKLTEMGDDASAEDEQEFTSWDLETKMWHLASTLYSFRLSEDRELVQTYDFSSFSTKQKAFLQAQPKLRELIMIIHWLQQNAQEVPLPFVAANAAKWANTKVALQNKDLATLASLPKNNNLVESLDVDAPLVSGKEIVAADLSTDSANFEVIYNLVLAGEYQRAVDYASQTGNFTVALILVGALQDYVDPVLDGQDLIASDNDGGDILNLTASEPSGLRHKYLWLQTVYNLSKEERLPIEERLIYSYLSGGDQTENIQHARCDWEKCLLLYVNQLLTHHVRLFMQTTLPGNGESESLPSVSFPTPKHTSVETILNTLLKSSTLSEESKNPFRVIMGAILINQLNFFLDNTSKSLQLSIVGDKHILRVLAHLAVFTSLCGLHEGSKTPTKIITRYISKLSEYGYEDLVPIYLAFIPDERDVRECYSIFLSTITDSEQRAKQLETFKRLGLSNPSETGARCNTSTDNIPDHYEYKIHNVLKRTVERVMCETEGHYLPQSEIKIENSKIDDVDFKLCKAVDWFYENSMYEDAISATCTVFQRFLSTGRLKAIKEFGKGKNLKTLLKNHDFDLQTKSLGLAKVVSSVTETQKNELLQYEKFLECLLLLDEWKAFIDDKSSVYWMSRDVEKSVQKVVSKIQSLILTWFREILETSPLNSEIYMEYRSIYVPYFIIELLQIFHVVGSHDSKYMRKAFLLVGEVANDKENDFLECFLSCGRISEFVVLAAEVAAVAADGNKTGITA